MDTEPTDFGLVKFTPEEMLAFRPTEESQDRVEILVEKSKAGTLTETEQAELEYFVGVDHFIRLLKNRAAKILASRAA